MNGIHDMGGMHGMGPIELEQDEPVFHESWEGRLFAIRRAMGAWGKWNIDALRHASEKLPARAYLESSYFARQFFGFLELLERSALVTREELETGRPTAAEPKRTPALTRDKVAELIAKGSPASRGLFVAPRFHTGQTVRTRNVHKVEHTRLPRYARGKIGTVVRDRGVFVFPDTNAHFLGENPQHLYSVRFTSRELWGQQASAADTVYLDLWDDYLEPA